MTPLSDRNTGRYTIAMSRRHSAAWRSVTGRRGTAPLWPVALAAAARLIAWLLVPASRFASDEDSYFQVSTALLTRGHQDLFWPPVTGWLIASVRVLLGTDSLPVLRLAWLAADVGCALGIRTLSARLGASLWPNDPQRGSQFAVWSTVGYALYLPAIAHAQFLTSEIPALALVLGMLVLLTGPRPGLAVHVGGGILAGILALTRPSLLPLAVLLPVAAAWARRPIVLRNVAVFVVVAMSLVSLQVYRNWRVAGELTISTNSAYNFYIGNRDQYAEDLNLFAPRATAEQIEFRRQQWSGTLVYPTGSPAELQRLAWQWVRDHPATFVRRATGRLARVFVPKTDVLEILGGELTAGARAPRTLALLAVTNLQWALVLFGGVLGLAQVRQRSPAFFALFIAAIAGAVALCLVAISKPRYSFVFDPILLMAACLVVMSPSTATTALTRRDWVVLGLVVAFLAWAWVAFAIFALTSRAAL